MRRIVGLAAIGLASACATPETVRNSPPRYTLQSKMPVAEMADCLAYEIGERLTEPMSLRSTRRPDDAVARIVLFVPAMPPIGMIDAEVKAAEGGSLVAARLPADIPNADRIFSGAMAACDPAAVVAATS